MKKITKDFINFSIGSISSLIIGFISTPIITHYFSPEQLGKYSAFDLVCSIIYIISMFGMVKGFERFFFDEHKNNRCRLLILCSKNNIIMLFLLTFIMLIFNDNIFNFVTGQLLYKNYSITILVVIVVILKIIREYCRSYIVLVKQNKLYSIISFTEKTVYLIVLMFVLAFTNKFMALILSNIIMLSTLIMIIIIYNRNIIKRKLKSIKYYKGGQDIIKYSYPFMLSSSINLIYSYVDKFCLKYYCGFEQLGLYTAAFRVTVIFNLTHTLINKFISPIIYNKYSNNRDVKNDLKTAYAIMGYVMSITAIGVIAFKDIFVLLLSRDYIESINIMPFLIFMPMMMGMGQLVSQGINLIKKTRAHIWISLLTVIFNLLTNMIFIPLYGIYAAAITTALTWILNYYIIYIYSQYKFKVDYNNINFTISIIVVLTVSIMQNGLESYYRWIMCLLSIVLISILFRKIIIDSIYYIKEKENRR